jgi:hypothetical protein
MDQELEEAYEAVEDKLFTAVKSALSRGSKALLGTYLNTLLSYPDRPFDNEPVVYPNRDEVIVKPVDLPKDKVYSHLFYGSTMQEKAMHLMGSKLEAALAIEGKFSEEGLMAMTAGEDMTTAMAKVLVEGLDVEGVEQIWSKLNGRNTASTAEEKPIRDKLFYIDPLSYPKKRKRRRKKRYHDPNQLWLPGFEPG